MADEFLARGRQVVAAQPFSMLLGARLDAFTPGQVTMAIPLQPDHSQQEGRVHDGVISYLAGNAMIFAGGSALGMPVVVAELKINYVRPAQGAELVARANAVCRCEVWVTTSDQEILVAIAQGTIISRDASGV